MTHEELLEEITANEEFYDDGTNRTPSWSALRAVVELHKPQSSTIPGDPKCDFCSGLDWADYPCQTIQAIEKELE